MPNAPRIPPPGIPPPEVEITDDLVAHLLTTQHPDLADRELRLFGSGWDNTTYRLGDDLAVRVPRRRLGAEMMEKERRWLGSLRPDLPLPIGRPVRLGHPDERYPWPWSIVPWYEGVSAEVEEIDPAEAGRFAQFLRVLHAPAPVGAPTSDYRGCPLALRAESVEVRLGRMGQVPMSVTPDQVASVWHSVRDLPIDASDVWMHGDLHPKNLIVSSGSLVAVIDWGDLCVGDPATDLASAWMLFPATVHEEFRTAYGPITADTWERARGWAIFFGVIMVDAGLKDDQRWAQAGMRTLERVSS